MQLESLMRAKEEDFFTVQIENQSLKSDLRNILNIEDTLKQEMIGM